jgi:hypothetical protein
MKEASSVSDLWLPGFTIRVESKPIQELIEIGSIEDQYITQV